MVNNENVSVNIDIGAGANLSGASIGNVQFIQEKSIIRLFNEAIEDVRSEIEQVTEDSLRRTFLYSLNHVSQYFNQNQNVLEKLLQQVNCKPKRNVENNKISLIKLINFLIIACSIDNNIRLPDLNANETYIKEKKSWIFNAAETNGLKLEKHISKIFDFIYSNPDYKMCNGICFITMLLDNGGLECKNCDGLLYRENKIVRILPDWLKSIFIADESEKDFFDLGRQHNIIFKCGECISNIWKFKEAQQVLGR